jgi:hypothetical protein
MIPWSNPQISRGKYVMNIKMPRTIVLLLSIVFVVGINSCDRSKTGQSKVTQSGNSPSIQTPAPPVQANSEELTDYNPALSLSPREYGRENPFVPLVRESRTKRPDSEQSESKPAKPVIILTATLGEDLAIFEVDGAIRSASVGDAIDDGEVLLSTEDRKYTITLGEQPKAVIYILQHR